MTSEPNARRVLYENLDTSFVNLWALLRYLSDRSFIGRVHVQLQNYEADVFVNGNQTPLVHEVDHQAGTDVVEEAALHRLVLRVRESPGSITVYEGADDAVAPQPASMKPQAAAIEAATPELMRSGLAESDADITSAGTTTAARAAPGGSEDEWHETLKVSGELIAAVERAAFAVGSDFAALFREARVALADDYTFLDPMAGLRYENATVTLNEDSAPAGYVAGISEALRRIVDGFAAGDKERRARERVALELSRVARKNTERVARSGFEEQLDRIAGTKVI